ncbi:MAG: hypothetical protein WBC98_03930 [Candidatus Zixiibacteriota bacterium]
MKHSTQLKFLKTLIDKLIKGRKHPTGAAPSSGMTNYFYGELPNHSQNTFSDDEKNEK